MKDVSIIIPSVTFEPFTQQCVSVCATLYPECEIILVLDDTTPVVTTFSNLTVLYGQTGVISKKRNTGVRAAGTEFIAFIDSDAYPHAKWLSSALETLKTDKSAGMVGGPNISPVPQHHSRNLVGMATKSWLVAGKWNFYKSENSAARYCDNLPSCNLVLRKSLYTELNGMNEELEVGEDTDFCARMIDAGYKVFFNPQSIVYHYDRQIGPYLRQRMVRGAGVYILLFGSTAQKKNLYTYILLQPVLTLLFWLTFPLGILWQPWFYIVGGAAFLYALLILTEAMKHSPKPKHIPAVAALIFAGNTFPGIGFILKMFRVLPSLSSFYSNYKH